MSGGERPSVSALASGVLALGGVTGAVLGLRAADIATANGALFALGYLAVAGTVAGGLAAFVGLPRLTGHLVAGVLAGPHGVGLVSSDDVKALSLINALALALIALQAGGELTVEALRRIWRSVALSSLAQIAVVIAPMAGVFYAARAALPFTDGLAPGAVAALGVLWGVVMLTRSPAVTLAVLAETRARGPLAEHTLGVVVLLDVLVLPLFAAALGLARGQLLGASFEAAAFLDLGVDLFASVCAGVTFGLLLALLLWATRDRVLVVVVTGYALTAISSYLEYDTLLVFVVVGFVVSNVTRLGPVLLATSERTATAVMVVFFATAGAKLDLHALQQLWPIAVVFFLARAVLTWIATRIGHAAAKDPLAVRRGAWLGLVSQAGVTIGLATLVAEALPEVGRALASLAIAVVALNELVGAVLFKLALSRAGEVGGGSPAAGLEGER